MHAHTNPENPMADTNLQLDSAQPANTPQSAEMAGFSPVAAAQAAPTHDQIARRAYEIYVRNGRIDGRCQRNWEQAERELRTPSEISAAPNVGAGPRNSGDDSPLGARLTIDPRKGRSDPRVPRTSSVDRAERLRAAQNVWPHS